MIEQALLLSKQIPSQLLSCLYANICCFHERQGDLTTARLYHLHAAKLGDEACSTNLQDKISLTINMNNLSVVELKAGNVAAGLAAAKRALSFIERDMLAEINKNAV